MSQNNTPSHQHFDQKTTYASGRATNQIVDSPFLKSKPSYLPGCMKLGIGVIAALIGAAIAIAGSFAINFATIIGGLALMGLAGIFLVLPGAHNIALISQFNTLGKYVGDKTYFKVSELAAQIKMPEDKIQNLLSNMLKKNFFKDASFSPSKDIFFVTDEGRQEYLRTGGQDITTEEAASTWADGYAFVQFLNKTSEQISQEDPIAAPQEGLITAPQEDPIAAKIQQLNTTMQAICKEVQNKPDRIDDLRRASNYYIPTTQKLLQSYLELQAQPNVGSTNITQAKTDIIKAMDMVNTGFAKVYDDLTQDVAIDISTDVSVMETMLTQDGLTENNDFKDSAKPEEQQVAQATSGPTLQF